MTGNDLSFLKNWFSDYSKSFYSSNKEDQKNIILKVQHTYNVCRNIIEIAESLSLSSNQMRLAETVALFHDLGRFPQYAKYKTFRDAISINHGLLGSKTLIKENVLRDLPENEQELIVQTVKFHSAFAIPTMLNRDVVLFLKLIRDADKVDIFRVFIEYYESSEEDRASATAYGLPDTPEYSKEILSSLYNKQIASYSNLKTLNDFKLMQLSWLYDFNFKASFDLLLKGDCLNKIITKLPQTDEICTAIANLQEYISQRLQDVHTS